MTKQPSSSESKQDVFPVKLSDFLRYPTLNPEPVSPGEVVTLTEVKMPDFHPVVADVIADFKQATVTVEILELFHILYGMYCRGQLLIDLEPSDDWPDFYEEYLGLNDSEPSG